MYTLYVSGPSGFPTDIQATAVSSTTIRVEWNNVEEAERNGNITHFEIIISLPSSAAVNESNITVQVSWKDRDFMFDDLEEFTEYNVSLRAFTVVGPGPFSPHLGVQTLEDGVCNYSEYVWVFLLCYVSIIILKVGAQSN